MQGLIEGGTPSTEWRGPGSRGAGLGLRDIKLGVKKKLRRKKTMVKKFGSE